jgi:hypothetical protein
VRIFAQIVLAVHLHGKSWETAPGGFPERRYTTRDEQNLGSLLQLSLSGRQTPERRTLPRSVLIGIGGWIWRAKIGQTEMLEFAFAQGQTLTDLPQRMGVRPPSVHLATNQAATYEHGVSSKAAEAAEVRVVGAGELVPMLRSWDVR